MLKQLVNECLVDLQIITDGPILIRSGMATMSGPDMSFVRTWRNGRQEVYLPGSSLKGTLRSHAERIARTLQPQSACDPFAQKENAAAMFCGTCFTAREKAKEELLNQRVYADSCPICRLFGSTWFAGRLATEDAYAVGNPQLQQRDGVGIDRFTGGAARGVKFDLEVVTEGTFKTRLHLRNFELWQLGLLGFVLADLKEGLIRVGAAKSRGLGRVRGEVTKTRTDFLGPHAPQPEDGQLSLKGVGSMIENSLAREYEFDSPDEIPIPVATAPIANGLRTTYNFERDSFPWAALAGKWVDKATGYQTPKQMLRFRGGR